MNLPLWLIIYRSVEAEAWRWVSEGFGKHIKRLLGFGADIDIGNCLFFAGLFVVALFDVRRRGDRSLARWENGRASLGQPGMVSSCFRARVPEESRRNPRWAA